MASAGTKRKNPEPSSTSSSSSGINYEVFLSFSGEDTRHGFTDVLERDLEKAGFVVFKDDKSLRGGEEIDQALKDAIKRSRISIAIFSEHYASSKSCLMELVQMWECSQSDDGQAIIPVFYNVTPYEVKNQAGAFAKSFVNHVADGKVHEDTIKTWKEVLHSVGDIKGFERAKIDGGRITGLLEKVVSRVRQLLWKDEQAVTDKLVGIDLHVREVMKKLGVVYSHGQAIKVRGEDVCVVGICGIRGVGKTTLAKLVYNKMHKLFYGRCFVEVENLRGVSDRIKILKGVMPSQELLIAGLKRKKPEQLKCYGDGMAEIERLFRNWNVLIVLDGVDKVEQIEGLGGQFVSRLGPGSRIIVTTDRKEVLKGFDFAAEEYEVKPMGDGDAFQLFWKHAVGGVAPPDDPEYVSLSRDIVKALGGIPQAIVHQAKNLKDEKIQSWEKRSKSLKHWGQDDEVEKAFKASYDSLEDRTKEIFLDIACFFIGKDERIPGYMWEAYWGRDPIKEIKCLRDVHFLEVGENNELRMHKSIRDFGRKLTHDECLFRNDRPKRCRCGNWNQWHKSHFKMHLEDTTSAEVIGLTVEGSRTDNFQCEQFQKMSKLRYLGLDRAKIEGDTAKLPRYLKWLDWRECDPIPKLDNMQLEKLVILDLSRSPVTKDSEFWGQIREKVEELKVLNLQGCVELHPSFNFPAPINLEMLILEDCSRLIKIRPFISNLKNLSSLNLRKCRLVEELPPELYCMESLRELLIDETGIKKIECKEGDLKNLETLSARNCEHLQDISAIGCLRKLSSLALDGADIDGLPDTFEFSQKLRTLSLRNCRNLGKLPTSIGKLDLLEEMDLSDTEIKRLPVSVKNLRNLKTLKMARTFLEKFPQGIMKLEKLEEIDFSGCTSLVGSNSRCYISGLSALRILRLSSSNVRRLPNSIRRHVKGISGLSSLRVSRLSSSSVRRLLDIIRRRPPHLRTLELGKCKKLHELPELPSSLLSLHWGSKIMAVPNLTNLTNLKELCLIHDEQPGVGSSNQTPDIGWITKLTSLETLEVSLPNVTNLPGDLSALTQLRELTLSYMKELDLSQLPSSSSLLTLCLRHCKIQVPKFSGLQLLSELELEECDLGEIDGLKDITCLVVLKVFGCSGVTDLNALKDLRHLRKVQGTFSARPRLPELSDHVELDIIPLELKDGVEAAIESMEELEDESGQPPVDMETSDRNYAIAAVQNVVGIDDRAKQITDLLEMEVDDEVRILGIFGTDGIGKTTLAKAVYDRISSCFDGRSFLTEVKETAQDATGIQFLQTKLIRDILERDRDDPSFDERIDDFLDIFRERKVLLVVDDVEEKSHLHAIVGDQLHRFGPGSRIIVTSQNEEILEEYDSDKARTYPVCPLEDGQAFELFCKHAFRMQSSIPDYDGLSNRIVNATDKLPLAVEVVGSFLRGKSIQEWKRMEKSMKERTRSSRKTTVGPKEILDICCRELDQQQKEIFLDIACFISGVDARIASCMWPSSYRPSSGCILMPLAIIGENNELQMHRLLRRLGKRILNQEESQDPRSRRFCTQDMVLKAINRETRMGNVEALCFDFTAGDFQSMPNVRFVKLDNANLSGDFEGAFPSLRGLCWQRCPPDFSAENLVLSELVILDLSWSKVTEDWGGWIKIKMEKLKVLNLTGCSELLVTPNFSGYKDLEILILEGCSRLVNLDPSISHLKHLVSLNLKFCSRLNSLPEELRGLTALKELFIDGTSVREIPISVGYLKQLEILSGFKCLPLTHLPRSISFLAALSELSLDGAQITELPSSLGDLLNLRRLSLRDCRYLQELPDSVGLMGSSLEELDISATNISELPDSIRNLESLRVLRMDYSFVRAFPKEIGNLTKLEELHASWCQCLKGAIPSDIGGLHHLRSLTLGHSRISRLPHEISTIPRLHTLDLIQCNEIEELPKLPPSLIHLRVSSTGMKVTPLEDLNELEELCLSDGDPMENRPPSKQPMLDSNVIDEQSFSISFPKLRKLELSLSRVIKLKFGPTDIPPLKMLTHSGSSRKEALEFPKTLSVLKLYDSAIEEIEGLEGLEALRRLDISNCRIRNLHGIGQLTSLRSLILSDCDCLRSLRVSKLKSLKVLQIRRCKMIRQIKGLEKLTSSVKQDISECPMLKHGMARSTVM